MEILIAIWVISGIVTYAIVIINGDDEFEGSGFFFSLLIGPLILLWMAGVMLFEYINTPENIHHPKVSKPKVSIPPEDEINKLVDDLSSIFLDETRISSLRKQDFANVNRLCTLVSRKANTNFNKEVVLSIIESALDHVEEVYKSTDSVLATRKKAFYKAQKSLGGLNSTLNIQVFESDSLEEKVPRDLFDLSIDVKKFSSYFPEFVLVSEYPGEEYVLLNGVDGDKLLYSESSVDWLNTFQTTVDEWEVKANNNEAILTYPFQRGVNSQGLEFCVFEICEDGEFTAVVSIEGKSFRKALITSTSRKSFINSIISSLSNFPWLDPIQQETDSFNSLKELKKALKKELKNKDQAKSIIKEILSGIDDDHMFVVCSELRDLAEISCRYHPLVRSIIKFSLANIEIVDFGEGIADKGLIDLVKPGALDYTEAYQAILTYLQNNAEFSDDFLLLAIESTNAGEQSKYFKRAIELCDSFYSLKAIIESKNFTKSMWHLAEPILAADLNSIGSAIDPIEAALRKSLISVDDSFNLLNESLKISPASSEKKFGLARDLHYFSRSYYANRNEYFTYASELVRSFVQLAIDNTDDVELLSEIRDFCGDELNDISVVSALEDKYKDEFKKITDEESAADELEDLINHMCSCAVLVSCGDGNFSEEEASEIAKVRSLIRLFVVSEESVDILLKTGNQDLALAKAGVLTHVLGVDDALFGLPNYVEETISAIRNVQCADDLQELVKNYSSKITRSFHQKIALWAAEEVARADGLEEGEISVLNMLASAFNLDRKTNQEFFTRVAFPAVSDQFDYVDQSYPDTYSDFDRVLEEEEEGAEELKTILGLLGISSFSELSDALSDDDNDVSGASDSETWPDIFKFLGTGDLSEISESISNGADVNETVNYKGLENLHALTLCADKGELGLVKELIVAGADVNTCTTNLEYPTGGSGYETPLIAALKSGEMEIFDTLIEAGASVNPFKDRESGYTPLIMAAQHENLYAIRKLLSLGADVRTRSRQSTNAIKPLAFSTGKNALKCLQLLFDSGVDSNLADHEGWRPIHNVAHVGDPSMMRFFVEIAKVPIDHRISGVHSSVVFSTAIDIALSNGHSDLAEYLFSKDASLAAGIDPKKSDWLNQRNSLSAIFIGAMTKGLENVSLWTRRAIEQDVRLSQPTVKYLVENISEVGSDDSIKSWVKDFLDIALINVSSDDFNTDDYEEEDWLDVLEEAFEAAPSSMKKFCKAFNRIGIDLGKDLL